MKPTLSAQFGQQLHLTPQLLQSIRLLQLSGMQMDLEIRSALENNPLLELEESEDSAPAGVEGDTGLDVAAFDELPEGTIWDVHGAGWSEDDLDRMQRVAAGESTDPHVRVLRELALELDDPALAVAGFWLEHTDDAGYLVASLAELQASACARFGIGTEEAESIRQRLLLGTPAGLAACDLRECLRVQLHALPGRVAARHLAARILDGDLALLAGHDYPLIARALDAEADDVREAVRLILSLQPRPGEDLLSDGNASVVPDVLAWHADGQWRVALNPATTPRIGINPLHERALVQAGEVGQPLRDLLQEARWLTRGLSMRYETLLRATRAIVQRQAAFLARGDEAMAPLTLKEIADEIGMHESTISRIASGKYLQTPRGTFELKHLFAVRLEGASVSGQAVKAMVRRLIESEPHARPLADEAIAGLLARQGVTIARRTVAKYREQLDIAPARERRRNIKPLLARAG